MVNHPLMAFLHWNDEAATALQALDVQLELGILPDLLGDADHASLNLTRTYPASLLVFGGDLGHAHHPGPDAAVAPVAARPREPRRRRPRRRDHDHPDPELAAA